MNALITAGLLLVLLGVAYQSGWSRSRALATSNGVKVHSRPQYHGSFVAIWAMVPALVILGLWAWFARHPALYRIAARWGTRVLRMVGNGRGSVANLPLAGGWTKHRDFPIPQGKTFHDQWKARKA